jgi:hypothetical protein
LSKGDPPPALDLRLFWIERAHATRAKQKGDQPIENKQYDEILDFVPPMISMTYDQRREAFRFVWRKIPFVFAVFGPLDARNATGSARGLLSSRWSGNSQIRESQPASGTRVAWELLRKKMRQEKVAQRRC